MCLVRVLLVLACASVEPCISELSGAENADSAMCPLWMPSNGTCKSSDVVRCVQGEEGSYHLSLLPCFCLTRYGNSSVAVHGFCPFTCTEKSPLFNYVSLPAQISISNLSQIMCNNFSRKGQLCGQCEDGHALAAYSYTLKCVSCHQQNWLKYLGAAFGPQTIFFILVVSSRMSVTSGDMVGYVTISQVLATGIELRFKALESSNRVMLKLFSTIYGVWNLDFFRALYSPFCLNSSLPPLAVISLDYLVAVYPMLLIVITYSMLSLCGKYQSVLHCWTTLYRLVHRCYQACDIRNLLIDAFTTMLMLSYVKILNVSFELLLPVLMSDDECTGRGLVVFYSGHWQYFGTSHVPYAVLAILMSLVFNVFPLVLLTVYPCRCFNKCWRGSFIHNIMDNFNRCYKTRYRIFSVFYLYIRLINLSLLLVALSPTYFTLLSILYSSVALVIGLVQPYKVFRHNLTNSVFFALIAFIKLIEYALEFSLGPYEQGFVDVYYGVEVFLLSLPPLYGLSILLYQLFPKRLLPHKCLQCLRSRVQGVSEKEESFPHRISHAGEYSHLLGVNDMIN